MCEQEMELCEDTGNEGSYYLCEAEKSRKRPQDVQKRKELAAAARPINIGVV